MRQRFVLFTIDVWRFTPLAAVSIAVLVNVVNIRHVLDGELTAMQGLTRFAVAFVLALAGVGGISRMLTSYGRHVAREADNDDAARGAGRR